MSGPSRRRVLQGAAASAALGLAALAPGCKNKPKRDKQSDKERDTKPDGQRDDARQPAVDPALIALVVALGPWPRQSRARAVEFAARFARSPRMLRLGASAAPPMLTKLAARIATQPAADAQDQPPMDAIDLGAFARDEREALLAFLHALHASDEIRCVVSGEPELGSCIGDAAAWLAGDAGTYPLTPND